MTKRNMTKITWKNNLFGIASATAQTSLEWRPQSQTIRAILGGNFQQLEIFKLLQISTNLQINKSPPPRECKCEWKGKAEQLNLDLGWRLKNLQ